ncbi:MAG: response regulator [Flavobacteriaceae bacterium]|nr:response regulator [Flavobacteriaceae bacterium]
MALKILLIEDDAIEVMKFHRTVGKLKLHHDIIEANNGEEAWRQLEKKDDLPDLILLDLNMPRVNGIEFLTKLKNDDFLRYIPTIIVTTSLNQQDLIKCYQIGIAGYIVKPLRLEAYEERIEALLRYWTLNELIKV